MSKRVILLTALVSLAAAIPAASVLGLPAFKKAFVAKYVKSDSTDPKDLAFAEAVKTGNCKICHEIARGDRNTRNAYGKELQKFLQRSDAKNKAKIDEALDKVAKLKSNPDDPKSPTYGEKIGNGKLPAAD